jgi:membrane protein implicated in regulation of membrane protease activity
MQWWLWILGGLGLLVAETVTPGGFFAFFFGVAAILVGALAALGVAGPEWMHWLLFSVFSVLGLLVFRRPLMRRFKLSSGKPVDRMEGELGTVLEDVAPGGFGKVEVRGSSWSARTAGTVALTKGQRTRVERVEGLTLWIRPE